VDVEALVKRPVQPLVGEPAEVIRPDSRPRDHEGARRIVLALGLTGIVLAAELAGGIWTGSLALLSDAAHVFLDAFALGLSYAAIRLSGLPPDDRHTYGFHRLRVLAALANGLTLLIVTAAIFREAWGRLHHPEPVLAGPMLAVAVGGLVVNAIVALILRTHDHDDLNLRSAFLHVVGDALASLGVIAAGLVIVVTGWMPADPLAGVLVGLIILAGAVRLTGEAVHILVEGVPREFTAADVGAAMAQISGVLEVHDLHVWTLSPGFAALSGHVLLEDQALGQAQHVMNLLKWRLRKQFRIEHTTIQFECANCGQGTVACVTSARPAEDLRGRH
jgi:cobalt-zinc-cadmium efflux system protein